MTTTTRTCPSCDSPDGSKWHRLSCVEVRSEALERLDLLMKGAEIGYTYGALGRDFAQVLPEIRRLTAAAAEGKR